MSRQPEIGQIPADAVKESARLHEPIFNKRNAIVEKIDGFWSQALVNCVSTNVYIDDDDHALLDHLTKVEVKRNPEEPRAATIEFHFSPNEFIEEPVLVKEFKLDPAAGEFSAQFDFASETVPQKTKVTWKSEEKNLSKRKPTTGTLRDDAVVEDEDEEDDFEPGSFFSSFFDSESRQVAGSIGRAIVEDLFPNAVQHYENPSLYDDEEEEDESDDEEDEEDEDDADKEIDLEEEEKRPSKKSRSK
ncbi:hypothetical protein MVES1_000566 [Malassezia vespertilionis]|uniref:uncharacterized protein n=1 Tax=Malassezia vespertilionis TaxID=2020962 RepID=UPI0024B174A6|nr:uncharacterized protein MVES1_000566 [Malassezia vespertilionis]WFD05238.1 hypothetical protein MVES1_000566 [Malassezia vespertilionis]